MENGAALGAGISVLNYNSNLILDRVDFIRNQPSRSQGRCGSRLELNVVGGQIFTGGLFMLKK